MAVCTRGSQRGGDANRWEKDGDCRRKTNGGKWRSTTVGSVKIRMTTVNRRTRRFLIGGTSGFDALLGGGRSDDGQYARLEAHGFYWTASESGPAIAWFYNFGKGGLALNRHGDGEKQRAFSVRCVTD